MPNNLFMELSDVVRAKLDHLLITGDASELSELITYIDDFRLTLRTGLWMDPGVNGYDFFWCNNGLGLLTLYVQDTMGHEVHISIYNNCLILMMEFFRLSGLTLTTQLIPIPSNISGSTHNVNRHPLQLMLASKLRITYERDNGER